MRNEVLILQLEWAEGTILLVEFLTKICAQLRAMTKYERFFFFLASLLSFFRCHRQNPNASHNIVAADFEVWMEHY